MGHDVTCFNRGGHHVSGVDFDEKAMTEYKGVKLKRVFTVDAKGLAAVTSSFFAAVKAAFGKFDVVHAAIRVANSPTTISIPPSLDGIRL